MNRKEKAQEMIRSFYRLAGQFKGVSITPSFASMCMLFIANEVRHSEHEQAYWDEVLENIEEELYRTSQP
jgi:hypothetical protein